MRTRLTNGTKRTGRARRHTRFSRHGSTGFGGCHECSDGVRTWLGCCRRWFLLREKAFDRLDDICSERLEHVEQMKTTTDNESDRLSRRHRSEDDRFGRVRRWQRQRTGTRRRSTANGHDCRTSFSLIYNANDVVIRRFYRVVCDSSVAHPLC
jgi:hypothetical protein